MPDASAASAVKEPDPDVLRPMSKQTFDAACKEQGYARGVTLIGSDAYSIRCVNEDGSLQTFPLREDIHNSVAQACQDTYRDKRVTDRLATMGGTYTAWQCADYGSYAGIPDLKGWCGSRGLQLVGTQNYRYPAYRWFCANSSKTRLEGIPMDRVCSWQFDESALDRVFNVYGKTVEDAWDCFYTRT
ncbi:hypothetical protein ABZY81_35245 [Streptomyces sp. NPDC006514]|uniref:hypothetical protein n=1 Tax=Streptomyces sp. NPDC006514 TaxID=3154308 RepID=UPI0033A20E56